MGQKQLNNNITLNCKKTLLPIVIIISVLLFCLLPTANAGESAIVVRVVDGDTLLVVYDGVEEYVRLIGVDTPESRRNKKAKKDAARLGVDIEVIIARGKLATKFVKGLLKPGDEVMLEFQGARRGYYKRLLCNVYLPDGRMLNKLVLK